MQALKAGYEDTLSYNKYRKIAGEIESWDVESRLNMTAEQRKNTRPDIDRTDVVFADDGGVNYSYDVTQDEIDEYVERSKSKENDKDYKKYATVSNKLISDVSNDIDLSGYSHALRDNDIRHILNSHGESTNEKYPVTLNDVKSIPFIVENYDKVFYKTNDKGQPGIVYVKVGSNNVVYYVEAITEKYGAEKLLINKQMLKTGIDDIPNLFGLKNAITKKQTESEFLSDLLQIRKAYARSEYQNQSVNNSISPTSEKVNNKFSAKDSEYLELAKNPEKNEARLREILDFAVVTSTYSRRKNNVQNLINNSTIYYINENKNRTDKWLSALGLQLPSAITTYGSINRITEISEKVNNKNSVVDSVKDSEYLELAKNPCATQSMQGINLLRKTSNLPKW